MEYRRDIDGLRAVAVLAVVLAHADFAWFSGGFVGVDIFFVISGYLITGIIAREIGENRFSLAGFYERRVRRILPALFVMMAVCLIGGWFLLPPPQYETLGWSALAATFFVSNIYFQRITGDYFASDAELEPLLHTWSLGVEEQFYIVIPLLLMLLLSRIPKLLKSVMIAGVAGSFALSAYATHFHPVANFYALPTRAWELGIGALLALGVAPSIRKAWGAQILALAGIGAIVFAVLVYDKTTAFPGVAALLPVLGSAILIWVHREHQTWVGRVLSMPPMVGIGLISYSLYLWHWPLLVVARNYTVGIGIDLRFALIAVATGFVLAWLSYRFVEQPFRRGHRQSEDRKKVFGAAAVVAIATCCVAATVAVKDGFWSRSPQSKAAYFAAKTPAKIVTRCFKNSQAQDAAPVCVLNAPASTTSPPMLVWGDSHARALLPAFAEVAKRNDISAAIATKSGCGPILGINRPSGRATQGCSEFNMRVLEYLRAKAVPQTVVLMARWPFWAEGTRAKGESGGLANLVPANEKVQRYGDASHQLLEAGLEDLLSALDEAGHNVVILSGVPELGWNPPEKLLIAEYGGLEMPPGPLLADVRERQAKADAILARLARKSGATLIDTASVLCDVRCRVRKDDILLYRDDDHLSEAGAKFLLNNVEEQILVR